MRTIKKKMEIKAVFIALTLLILTGTPFVSFGATSTYQYDPAARLTNLQSTYPGGVQALYSFCADKLSQKLNYLKNLGITFSDTELKDETYQFLGSCIYGQEDYEASRCGASASGINCQIVTLPLDLTILESLSGANAVSSAGSMNLSANFY
jgi:hypothetical protein